MRAGFGWLCALRAYLSVIIAFNDQKGGASQGLLQGDESFVTPAAARKWRSVMGESFFVVGGECQRLLVKNSIHPDMMLAGWTAMSSAPAAA